jgi:hypothetical protein
MPRGMDVTQRQFKVFKFNNVTIEFRTRVLLVYDCMAPANCSHGYIKCLTDLHKTSIYFDEIILHVNALTYSHMHAHTRHTHIHTHSRTCM